MEVIKYLYRMFNSKQALLVQVSLSSLVGLFVILFNNFAPNITNLFFDNFYVNASPNTNIVRCSIAFAVLIFMYIFGYLYKMLGSVNSDGSFRFSQFDLEPFVAFIRFIPLLLVWGMYYIFLIYISTLVIENYSTFNFMYIVCSLAICLIPFVAIIFSKFAKDFTYHTKYFAIRYIFKIIYNSLGKVIYLSLQSILLFCLGFLALKFMFTHTAQIKSETWLFGVRYMIVCLSVYLFVILNQVYLIGLARIADTIRE
ncbi:MAG: hypothetical protein ACI37Q_00470 [Candidatus Gastranaerophilaceae bacterium]